MSVTPSNPKILFDGINLSVTYIDNNNIGIYNVHFSCSDGVLEDEFEFTMSFLEDQPPFALNP